MIMPQVIDGKKYMTTTEAARYLGMSEASFRNKYMYEKHKLFIRKLRQHRNPNDTRERLYLIADLDELRQIEPGPE